MTPDAPTHRQSVRYGRHCTATQMRCADGMLIYKAFRFEPKLYQRDDQHTNQPDQHAVNDDSEHIHRAISGDIQTPKPDRGAAHHECPERPQHSLKTFIRTFRSIHFGVFLEHDLPPQSFRATNDSVGQFDYMNLDDLVDWVDARNYDLGIHPSARSSRRPRPG